MKKLLFLICILVSANCFAQVLPPFQWPPLSAFNQTTGAPAIRATAKYAVDRNNDSLQINQRITVLENGYKALPLVPKEVIPTVQSLNTIIKGLRDTNTLLLKIADTSWKKAIRELQAANEALKKELQEMKKTIPAIEVTYPAVAKVEPDMKGGGYIIDENGNAVLASEWIKQHPTTFSDTVYRLPQEVLLNIDKTLTIKID